MFIKKIKKTYPNTGKSYFVFQLFESIQTAHGIRQKMLLSMGPKLNLGEKQHQLLADCIDTIVNKKGGMLAFPSEIESLALVFAAQLEKRNRSRQYMHKNAPSGKTEQTRRSLAPRKTLEFADEEAPRKAFIPRLASRLGNKPTVDKDFRPPSPLSSKTESLGHSKRALRRSFTPSKRKTSIFKTKPSR